MPVRAQGSTVIEPVSAAAVAALERASARRRMSALIRAYVGLTKPRIVELLLVTTVPAMLLAARGSTGRLPSLALVVAVLVGGAFAAGSANAFNCYLDRDIDPLMRRTAGRALPRHTVSPRAVLLFATALLVSSTAIMLLTTNLLATALTVGAVAYYDLVYTLWLKRTTPHNTVLGGVCGAAPVLIGWAAVTGGLDARAWLLFTVVFLWQPPHFFALAIKCKDDYARAGIPMLPVVASRRRVGVEIIAYSWLTVAASVALWPLGMSLVYGLVSVVAGGVFLVEAHRLGRQAWTGGELAPMRFFHFSTTYLTLLFGAVALDVLLR